MAESLKNCIVETLVYADGSKYRGQVLPRAEKGATKPHGYGVMEVNGFKMEGYFQDGKACGPGWFTAPNGDLFVGAWNANHKRHGEGMHFSQESGARVTEKYDDGKLLKRVKLKWPSDQSGFWRSPSDSATSGEPPSIRMGHSSTVVLDGAMVVVFGGMCEKEGKEVCLNDLHIFDVANKSWISPQIGGTPPPPMYAHTATAVGDKIFIIGGQNGIEVYSSVYVFDCASGEWSVAIAKGFNFAHHTATLVDHFIYVIQQGALFVLDVERMEWLQPETDNKSLFRNHVANCFVNHTACAVGRDIFVFGGKIIGGGPFGNAGGGKNYQRCSSSMLCLNVDTLTWTVLEVSGPESKVSSERSDYSGVPSHSWKLPRAEHTMVLVKNRYLVVHGGWTTCSPTINVVDNSFLHDIQIFDTETLTWLDQPRSRVFSVSVPRGLHTANVVGDELYILGGHNHAHEGLYDFAIFHLGLHVFEPPPPQSVSAAASSGVADGDSKSVESSSSSSSSSSETPSQSPPQQQPQQPQQQPQQDQLASMDASSAGSGSVLDAFKRMQVSSGSQPS